jgi:IS30 family transposase
MNRSGQNLNEEEKILIRILKEEKYSITTIAAVTGWSKTTIKRVLRETTETV